MRSERVSSHKSLEFWVQNGNTSSMCLIRGYIFCEPNHSPKIRHGVVPRDCV